MLKVTVIYDNNDKGIEYKSVQFILNKIQSSNINIVVNEFSIADDFDSCFFDCYSACQYYCTCEDKITYCPYLKIIKKLSYSLNNSDLIILASCSSKHSIGSNMYRVLENLSYKWMPHKHDNFMVNKIALAISTTTSFAPFSYANMTLSRILRFWGINKHSIFAKSLSKYSSNNLTKKEPLKLTSQLTKLASKIVYRYRQTSAVIIPNFNNKNTSYISDGQNEAYIIKFDKNNSDKKYINRRIL